MMVKTQKKNTLDNKPESFKKKPPKPHPDKHELIMETALILGQQNDFQEILRLVTQKASVLVNGEMALIMMLNPRTQKTVKTIYSKDSEISKRKDHLAHVSISGWVMKYCQSLISEDIKRDSRFRQKRFKDTSIEAVICVPLYTAGSLIGTLLIINNINKQAFSQKDLTDLEKFAAIVSPYLHNIQKIQEYFNMRIPEEALRRKYEVMGLLGKSQPFLELLRGIEAAAACDVRVLLEGNSGTGKELIAKAIHKLGSRSQQNFVALDCGSIPPHLIESELFGHVKGAFTGANMSRKGLFEEADNGTLFMDEVNNLPLELQAKLLRALQEGEIRPLGSNRSRKVDVRIISAFSSSLRELVNSGKFREDLFYRLNVYPIYVPSLSSRRDDIPLLARHFLKVFATRQKKHVSDFEQSMIDFLQNRSWPGNIRELENFIERMITLAPAEQNNIGLNILPKEYESEYKQSLSKYKLVDSKNSLKDFMHKTEKGLIIKSLIENNWNQSKAARALNISERMIRYRITKLGISKAKK
jgi:transcriptional regulator with GAF, ATPase, and Fis domain